MLVDELYIFQFDITHIITDLVNENLNIRKLE